MNKLVKLVGGSLPHFLDGRAMPFHPDISFDLCSPGAPRPLSRSAKLTAKSVGAKLMQRIQGRTSGAWKRAWNMKTLGFSIAKHGVCCLSASCHDNGPVLVMKYHEVSWSWSISIVINQSNNSWEPSHAAVSSTAESMQKKTGTVAWFKVRSFVTCLELTYMLRFVEHLERKSSGGVYALLFACLFAYENLNLKHEHKHEREYSPLSLLSIIDNNYQQHSTTKTDYEFTNISW